MTKFMNIARNLVLLATAAFVTTTVANAQLLNKAQLKELTATAKTAQDHEKLAKHFDARIRGGREGLRGVGRGTPQQWPQLQASHERPDRRALQVLRGQGAGRSGRSAKGCRRSSRDGQGRHWQVVGTHAVCQIARLAAA